MSSEECSSCSPLLVYLLSLLIVISPFVMSFFLVRLLSFFFFLLLAAAFLHLVFCAGVVLLWPVLRFSQQTSVCVPLVG